jgi:hypothetical protein
MFNDPSGTIKTALFICLICLLAHWSLKICDDPSRVFLKGDFLYHSTKFSRSYGRSYGVLNLARRRR